MEVQARVQEEGMGLFHIRRGKQDGGMPGKGHGAGQHLAPAAVHISKEEVKISNTFSKCFLEKQQFFTCAVYCSINRRPSPGFGEPGIALSKGSQMFSQLNCQAWKHWIAKRKFSRKLRFLVGICPWWAWQLGVQNTVLLLASSTGTANATAGNHSRLWFLTSKGAGACRGAVLHEQFMMRWISLQHCWEARDVSQAGNSPPRWRRMTGSSCTGSLAPVPPGPAALWEHSMLLSVSVRTALGPRPPESTIGSARSAQQEEILGRVGLWSSTSLSWDSSCLFLAQQQICYGHTACPVYVSLSLSSGWLKL